MTVSARKAPCLATASLLAAFVLAAGCASRPERSDYPRRIAAASDGAADEYDFFFASARTLDGDYWGAGKELAAERTLGTYRARVAAELHIGEHSNASSWQETKELEVVSARDLDEEQWWRELEGAVERSPHGSLMVVVWGWKERFESAALKTAYTAAVLDIATPVLLFDWPSNQGNSPVGYTNARKLAAPSGAALGRLLGELSARLGSARIWVLGSSLGCQVICDAFEWMFERPELADAQVEIDHVVLSAPDVSDAEFEGRFRDEIAALSRHLTACVSSTDQSLLLSSWINLGRRLGRRPPEAPGQLEETTDLLALEGASQVDVVDVTPINRTRHYHHFFTDSPEFFDHLYEALLDPDSMDTRRLYRVKHDGDAGFWILWGYEDE